MEKMKLRHKITLIFAIVATCMCIALSLLSIYSADKLIEAIPLSPTAQKIEDIEDFKFEEITPAIPTQTAKSRFRISTLYTMIGIILIGGTAIYLLSKKSLKPLEQLSQRVKTQGPDELSEEIPLPLYQDEVYELTKSFNQRNKQIYEAYTMQKNFSANVAHELFTPLAVMQAKLEVFELKKDKTPEEYEQLFALISQNNQRFTSIIEELLHITNMQQENLNEQVFLYDIAEETVFELEDAIQAKGIECTISGERLVVTGSDTLLKQAIYNLVSNAIRYNVEKGKVAILLYNTEGSQCVSVSDTGLGVPDDCKQNIFEPFYRVDKSRSRALGGSGLGLALVRKIAELHGGKITIEDNTPSGSVFTLSL